MLACCDGESGNVDTGNVYVLDLSSGGEMPGGTVAM